LKGAKQSEKALATLREVYEDLHSELSECMEKWTTQLENAHFKLNASASDLMALQKEARQLCKIVVHSKETKNRAIASVKEKISQQQSVYHLMSKGVFTEETMLFVCWLKQVVHVIISMRLFPPSSNLQESQLLAPSVVLLFHAFFVSRECHGYEKPVGKCHRLLWGTGTDS